MEGDAGASWLNRTDADDSSSSEVRPRIRQNLRSEPTRPAPRTAETPETNAEDVPEADDNITATNAEDDAGLASPVAARGPSRLGRGWLIGITAALLGDRGDAEPGIAAAHDRDAFAVADSMTAPAWP
jgi:Mce-associated membrane protein